MDTERQTIYLCLAHMSEAGLEQKYVKEACNLFKELEGIDIHPAAGVATSSLIKAVKDGKVQENDIVMLNICRRL